MVLVAAGPFALAMCARVAVEPVEAPETFDTPVASPSPTPTPSPFPSPSSPPTPPPPYTGALPADCSAIQAAINKGIAVLGCAVDTDCGNFQMQCGCAQAVAVSALPKLNALEQTYEAKDCMSKSKVPIPCATCPMPLPRKCVSGKCE